MLTDETVPATEKFMQKDGCGLFFYRIDLESFLY